ncbi:ATP-grasp domain-containing protein [Streptococcus sanguinis]|uniref:Alanine-anticapsin ligase BacD n=1 Tax=Streptococcus sanguinis TaxID=1305 RepID=A0A3R9H8Z4_STRSA|nr:ATP-grasp domain-containing protein [Streptococcus sanguinis]RSI10593.1 Alanine-anticapsin ligase BacD [Streptococcus sanguinis]
MVHLLLLGSSRQAYTKLKKAVNNCDLTIINTTNMLKPFYSTLYSRVLTTPIRDDLEWTQLAKIVHNCYPIDRVITLDDNLQELAYRISEFLHIPTLCSLNTINLLNNKLLMRNFLKDKNFNQAQAIRLEKKSDLRSAMFEYGTVIIKPILGSGSKDIFKVSNLDDCATFFKNSRKKISNFLVEPFFEGEEYSIESYSEDGKHRIYGVTKKIKDNYFVETGHIVPGIIENQNLINKIKERVKEFLDVVGFTDGPAHTEIIISPEEINIVESQPRIGGDMINDLYELAMGIDIFSLIMQGLSGEKVFDAIPEYCEFNFDKFAFVSFLPSKTGKVISIKNNINLENDNCIKGFKVGCDVGEQLIEDRSSSGRLAYYWGTAQSYSEAMDECLKIKARIKIQTNSNLGR